LAFYGIKLSKLIKVHKDSMPIFFSFKCVYKIKCLYCDASYVEQTRRLLKNRIEYKNHIRRNTTQISVITEHRLKHSHEFD